MPFISLLDVLAIVLKNKDYCTDWQPQFAENDGKIAHPSNTDGWKELESHFKTSFPQHQRLFVTLFMDEYNQSKMSKQKVNSILFTAANATQEVRTKQSSDVILMIH